MAMESEVETLMDQTLMEEPCAEDVVDEILRNGAHCYMVGQKIELARKRPTPPLNLSAMDGKTVRKFQFVWYSKYPWLTGSPARSHLYCYFCLLFMGDRKWGAEGVPMTKNFLRIANKHAVSQRHLSCHERFKLLGKSGTSRAASADGRRLAALRHNERVGVYRRALSRLVRAVCRLAKPRRNASLGGVPCNTPADDEDDYLELLDRLSEEERLLGEQFASSPAVFRGTACVDAVQNDLVSCVAKVLNVQISNELNRAKFVSVQADETTDVSCAAQMSVVFRYVIDNNVEERFVGFFDVPKNRTEADVASVLSEEIRKWNVADKLVCQTYDGAIAMGGVVPAVMKMTFPNAVFVHCYSHDLNLVVLHGLKTIGSVRIFVSDLTMFHSFFSGSQKRSRLLREKGFELLSGGRNETAQWNYRSGAVATISAHYAEIRKAVSLVADDDDWDPTSVGLACVLSEKLSNFKFLFLLRLFGKIFALTDGVFASLQSVCVAGVQNCVDKAADMSQQLAAMRNKETVLECCESAAELSGEFEYSKNDVESLEDLTYEILDSLIVQTDVRFQDMHLLHFVEIANHCSFKKYKKSFPTDKLLELNDRFPGVFDVERLTNELTIIFNSTDKHLSAKELLNYIFIADLQEVYQELTKLLQLILCIPATPASSVRSMTTLKRIKTFLVNSMNSDRLSNFCSLAIENEMLAELMIDPTFIDRVIDLFSETKNRMINLTYKVI